MDVTEDVPSNNKRRLIFSAPGVHASTVNSSELLTLNLPLRACEITCVNVDWPCVYSNQIVRPLSDAL